MTVKLNTKQRNWLARFLQQYPYYRLTNIVDDLGGDRILTLEGWQQLPLPPVAEMEGAAPGYRCHELKVKLRKFGDPRSSAEYKYNTVYPHCDLGKKPLAIQQYGQLSLSISAALELPVAVNPVTVHWKPKRKVEPKVGQQLSLPVVGLEAKLFRLRQEKQPHLPPVSSQELLKQKVETWSLRDRRSIEVPRVLLDLLRSQNASEEESQNALNLLEVTGLGGAVLYVEGLTSLRKWLGNTTASTVSASIEVSGVKLKNQVNSPVKVVSCKSF